MYVLYCKKLPEVKLEIGILKLKCKKCHDNENIMHCMAKDNSVKMTHRELNNVTISIRKE